jgi:hypothetical protein
VNDVRDVMVEVVVWMEKVNIRMVGGSEVNNRITSA